MPQKKRPNRMQSSQEKMLVWSTGDGRWKMQGIYMRTGSVFAMKDREERAESVSTFALPKFEFLAGHIRYTIQG